MVLIKSLWTSVSGTVSVFKRKHFWKFISSARDIKGHFLTTKDYKMPSLIWGHPYTGFDKKVVWKN